MKFEFNEFLRLGQPVIIILNQLTFILANFLLFVVFNLYFESSNVLLIGISLLLSILILGKMNHLSGYIWGASLTVCLIWILDLSYFPFHINCIMCSLFLVFTLYYLTKFMDKIVNNDKNNTRQTNVDSSQSLIDRIDEWKKIIYSLFYVIPRLFFFNILYFLFPLLIIWLTVTGALLFFGFGKIIHPYDLPGDLFKVVTMIGVVFGFFQFYFYRQKNEVQKKLQQHMKNITTLDENLTYNKFLEFVKNHYADDTRLEKCKSKIYDQNMKSFADSKYLTDLNDLSSVNKKIYDRMETRFSPSDNDKLRNIYNEFFEEQKRQIKFNLSRSEKNEIMWTLMGNINIFIEDFATILTFDSKMDEPKTFQDFKNKANKEIFEEIINEWLFGSSK